MTGSGVWARVGIAVRWRALDAWWTAILWCYRVRLALWEVGYWGCQPFALLLLDDEWWATWHEGRMAALEEIVAWMRRGLAAVQRAEERDGEDEETETADAEASARAVGTAEPHRHADSEERVKTWH